MAFMRCCSVGLLLVAVAAQTEHHCLAQKTATIKKVQMRVSASSRSDEKEAATVEASTAEVGGTKVKRSLVQALVAEAATIEQARPNGPLQMNLTNMDEHSIPKDVRHVNGETQTSDWFNEYGVSTPVEPAQNLTNFTTSHMSAAHGTSAFIPLLVAAAAVVFAGLPRP
mmetsp:Transcript_93383/g.247905  ORF Transcript_93383/g.247905 Transcript_93383/m.247905 type:complete len:169 (-) Transcript_93383:65-571(-)